VTWHQKKIKHIKQKKREKAEKMPHCNDWIPLVLLLGLIPLAFWHHKDRKDDEEKKNSDRDGNLLTTTPATFYRQDPYFVVDVPLWATSGVTHISFGNASARQALATFPSSGIDIKQGQPEVTTAWGQLITLPQGRTLRIWKPISTSSTLDEDRNWFNALDVYLWNKTNTTRTRLNHAQIRVPPFVSGTTTRQNPLPSDMIRYQNIPVLVPEDLEQVFQDNPLALPYFNFHTVQTEVNGQVQISFGPITSYDWSWPLEFAGLRGPDDAHMVPVPIIVSPPTSSINARRTATFDGDVGDLDDFFVVEMFRRPPAGTNPVQPIRVAAAVYQSCVTDYDPEACGRLLCNVFGLCDLEPDFQARNR
jgi:hypothetical protein